MKEVLDGNALVYCEGAYNTPNGKTAHGLVRFTHRYNVVGVIDQQYAGQDAGSVLDHKANGIPVYASLEEALKISSGFAEQLKKQLNQVSQLDAALRQEISPILASFDDYFMVRVRPKQRIGF